MSTTIFAHRGVSSQAPENTMEAFELVTAAGADGIEMDVQFTKDGKVVILHDELIDRTSNGTGLVRDWLWDDLRRLDFGSWFGPLFAGARIPLLSDLLLMVKRQGLRLNIELKTNSFRYPGLEEAVIEMVRAYSVHDAIMISSFNHYSVMHYKALDPAAYTGVLLSSTLVDPWEYAGRLGVQAVHPRYRSVDQEMVTRCHERGIEINTYTVDDPEDKEMLKAMGVDCIITNCP